MSEPSKGDRVSFRRRGRTVSGTVVRVNRKTVTCDLDNGRRVRVPNGELISEQASTNIIKFPHHACGVGSRVWFMVGHRYPLSGKITTLDRHGAKVVPDCGCAEYYQVAHSAIYSTRDEALASSPKTMSNR